MRRAGKPLKRAHGYAVDRPVDGLLIERVLGNVIVRSNNEKEA